MAITKKGESAQNLLKSLKGFEDKVKLNILRALNNLSKKDEESRQAIKKVVDQWNNFDTAIEAAIATIEENNQTSGDTE